MLLLLEGYLTAEQLAPPRISGGKRIAAYTIDDNGKLRNQIDALIEQERRQEEALTEIILALAAYWRRDD